jgi:secreted trypsin-like serine protease
VRFGSPSYIKAVVAIYYQKADGNAYICSGLLVTDQIILTAGHCGCGLAGSYWVNLNQDARRQDPSQMSAVSGPPILFDQRVCRNGYLGEGNDLALIRLHDAVPAFNEDSNSRPWTGYGYPNDLVFALRGEITKGMPLTVIGYGYTESRQIGFRNEGQVAVYSFDCEEATLNGICSPFSEIILADAGGGRPANDTCGGDSGGPVFWIRDGVLRLVAITSRAAPGLQENSALHCGGGGIYTLIGRKNVHAWLEANGVPPLPQATPEQLKAGTCLQLDPLRGPAFENCMKSAP